MSLPHGFAVRVSAYVPRAGPRSQDKPALRLPLRTSAFASTASHPAFVTIAIRPSCWDETGSVVRVIWVYGEAEYFCESDWTRQIALKYLRKRKFARSDFD